MVRKKLRGRNLEDSDDEEDNEVLDGKDQHIDDALSDEYDEHKGGRFATKKKQASIDFYSYEFEHLIKGSKGDQLTRYLAEQPLTSPVFESTTI